ncbi:hypothetical protein TSAR_012488 [Trichomalopsis sarcophagae]|uniref:Uncharacterized protein n=1 Tax=Trichomalopsis sarcophagae TaxID=543379 RepID=A0A232F3R6_9HYME|nr:hypothetical protein TSAR_012488 [Trichomalopsis sarcophagae]
MSKQGLKQVWQHEGAQYHHQPRYAITHPLIMEHREGTCLRQHQRSSSTDGRRGKGTSQPLVEFHRLNEDTLRIVRHQRRCRTSRRFDLQQQCVNAHQHGHHRQQCELGARALAAPIITNEHAVSIIFSGSARTHAASHSDGSA